MTVKLLGKKKFYSNVKLISKVDFPGLYKSSLAETVDLTMKDSLSKTPIDTGLLRASARNKVDKVDAEGGSANVSYHASYSIPVHEILTNHHPIGRSKFLEAAVMFMMPMFPKLVGKRIGAYLKKAYHKNARSERLSK